MNEHEENAAFYIGLFDQFVDRLEELDSKRYNKEFLEAYGVQNPTAPIVLMFNAFVAGVDMGGGKIIEKLYTMENAPTENR